MQDNARRVLSFYKFVAVENPEAHLRNLLEQGNRLALKGTILLAGEGVNGTLIGTAENLHDMVAILQREFGEMPCKWSSVAPENPGFHRYKVRVKSEIVSLGVDALDMAQGGRHVDVAQWHTLLDDPEVLLIDTRNTYEVDIGTFPGAVSPMTTSFREFPQWVAQNLDPQKDQRIAMFCTGGIRCEKASALLAARGFAEVYQLDGGILNYLDQVAEADNRWQGECFVFDQRVSVDANLAQGQYTQCYACRHPLSESDVTSVHFEQGVSCPHCIENLHATKIANLRERQRQVDLADARGEQHIGKAQGAPPGYNSGSR